MKTLHIFTIFTSRAYTIYKKYVSPPKCGAELEI